ncbi:PREDICTED: uncharacterized protein LOC109221509 [Nicotiana attenuata]|uniref:uncharacterized protein LOC109221509 n=1 Tax=Nicotiana attenuata TaxID=49451 RepID=UPI0009050DD5|nr:PREDICTED: uncharacterized protein LOC109221509 [Nicotiana attenuata]
MVDDESGTCIIHPRVLAQMRLEDKIAPRCITLTGFNSAVERTSGEIMLPVLAGSVTLETTFYIMNWDTTYNAIIGRPWIHAMRAILSSLYQVIKFPTPWGIFSIRGEHRTAKNATASPKIKDVIKDPDVVEAAGSTIEDLDPVQLDSSNSSKKAYIGHKLYEPDMPGIPKDVTSHKLNVDPFYPPVRQVRRKFNAAINEAVTEEVINWSLMAQSENRNTLNRYPMWSW